MVFFQVVFYDVVGFFHVVNSFAFHGTSPQVEGFIDGV